ncbi:MAG TPA: hypothetical protein GXZ58_00950 [Bacilli bacterium]|nr:hypothetical protein [Bacilli bacterium]
MRKINLIVFLVIGLLLVGCNNTEEINGSIHPTPTRPSYTLWELANKAEIIANLTVTERVEVLEVGDEYSTFIYSIFKATVNHYFYNELGYDQEIEILHGGGPTGQFADDPLLKIGETYILFLDEREDSDIGARLVITGGPFGRYNKVDDDLYVRQLNPTNSSGSSSVTEAELIEKLNRHNEDLNIDLSILD